MNRGNARLAVFRKDADYVAFVNLLAVTLEHVPVRLVGWCLMTNHFHLVIWPREDGDLSRFMQRLLTAHVRRYHQHHHTHGEGHIWQGRFKAFPIQQDAHLLTVLRYVERNALRANLVSAAEAWAWSSLSAWLMKPRPTMLHEGPVDRPRNWRELVNRPESAAQLEAIRRSVVRGSPFGSDLWTKRTAARLELTHTLNPRGRPRKHPKSTG